MKLNVSLAVIVFYLGGSAFAQDPPSTPPNYLPPSQGFPPPTAGPSGGGPAWMPPGNALPPEAMESMRSQMPPAYAPNPGGYSTAMPPAGPTPPTTGAKPVNPEQVKADKAAEKAREQMRKALRESAMERQREAELSKGKKSRKPQLEN